MRTSAGDSHYDITDALGSVFALTHSARNTSNLPKFGARYFSAVPGRFAQPDPSGQEAWALAGSRVVRGLSDLGCCVLYVRRNRAEGDGKAFHGRGSIMALGLLALGLLIFALVGGLTASTKRSGTI